MFSFRSISRAVALVCLGLPYVYGSLFVAYDGVGRSAKQIQDDFVEIKQYFTVVRTYATSIQSSDGVELNYIELAANNSLKILVGVGLKDEPQPLCDLLNKNSQIIYGVCVGNEDITNEYGDILGQIRKLKGCLDQSIPITTAQKNADWLQYSKDDQLVKEVSFLAVNIYTYWDTSSTLSDADRFFAQLKGFKDRFEGIQIVITETGWPSAGALQGQREASVQKLEEYFTNVLKGLTCPDTFWFMHTDVHKSDDKPIENNFGLYRADGSKKFSFDTIMKQYPQRNDCLGGFIAPPGTTPPPPAPGTTPPPPAPGTTPPTPAPGTTPPTPAPGTTPPTPAPGTTPGMGNEAPPTHC